MGIFLRLVHPPHHAAGGEINPVVDSDLLKAKLAMVVIMIILGNSSLLFIKHYSKCLVIINTFNPDNSSVMGVLLPSSLF